MSDSVRSGFLVVFVASLGCGGAKKPAAHADSDNGNIVAQTAQAGSDMPEDAPATPLRKQGCSGRDFENLPSALEEAACEVPSPGAGGKPHDLGPKLEVKLTSGGAKVPPGGHVDLFLTYTNKGSSALPLTFRVDPMPRFDVEAYDAKGRRIDTPAGKPPKLPKDLPPRVPGEARAARVSLEPGGVARVNLGWDAVKMKWAPELLRGTPPERGYPRSASGPLPKGTYTVKIATPLLEVQEGPEHEVTSPRVSIEVGK